MTDNVTYKPGWRVEMNRPLNDEDRHLLVLHVTALFPNSCGSEPSTVQVAQSTFIPLSEWERLGDMDQLEWVRFAVWQLEAHESDEWFKFRGTVVRDPHER